MASASGSVSEWASETALAWETALAMAWVMVA